MKTFQIVLIVVTLISCNSSQKKKMDKIENDSPVVFSKKHLVDSVLIARHNHVQTDILSKIVPNLKKSDAYDIQLAMMEKEIDASAPELTEETSAAIIRGFEFLLSIQVGIKDFFCECERSVEEFFSVFYPGREISVDRMDHINVENHLGCILRFLMV